MFGSQYTPTTVGQPLFTVSTPLAACWVCRYRHVARVAEESKITIDAEDYVDSFTPSMMEATFAWSNGADFSEVRGGKLGSLTPFLGVRL